jgi:hypothetical protein
MLTLLAMPVRAFDDSSLMRAQGNVFLTDGLGGAPPKPAVSSSYSNKKGTPVVVDLAVLEAGDVVSGTMTSVIGGGPSQTLGNGYHPLDYQGYDGQVPVIETWIASFDAIVLEPYSANIILLSTGEPHRVYVPLMLSAHDVAPDLALPPTPICIEGGEREGDDKRD